MALNFPGIYSSGPHGGLQGSFTEAAWYVTGAMLVPECAETWVRLHAHKEPSVQFRNMLLT